MGFEPMRDLHLLAVFETAPLSRLGTSPAEVLYHKFYGLNFAYLPYALRVATMKVYKRRESVKGIL